MARKARTLPSTTVLRDQRGNIAMPAAILLLPMVVLGLGAVDFARATMARGSLQDAVDSAALAVARSNQTDAVKLQAIGEAVLKQNLTKYGGAQVLEYSKFALGKNVVTGDARIAVKPIIAHLFTKGDLTVNVHSEVKSADYKLEIAMVLDNTWSMTEYSASAKTDKITVLEKASVRFVEQMQVLAAKGGGGDAVKLGVVPFSSTVNVGSTHATADWLDIQGLSSVNDNIFYSGGKGSPHSWKTVDAPKRLDLFTAMGLSWKGCVESRPAPYDLTDAAATSGTPDTLIVPYFAPDEPDKDAGAWNNYADDAIQPSWDNSGHLFEMYWSRIQGNVPKYTAASLNADRGYRGPNNGCDTEPVIRLTTDLAKVKTAVTDMPVGGATNIPMGLVWGWHVLSPNAPFKDGASYSAKNVRRVAVLMTDGENAIEILNNRNKSKYTGVGYIWQNRLGTTSDDFNTRKKAMDGRLSALCANMKAKGITIFTVQVEVNGTSDALLQSCASRPAYFYNVSQAAKLDQAFQSIANELTNLRIAK